MSGSNPPSTHGSPRLARRALLTAGAALAAVAAPAGLVAATTDGTAAGTSEAADAPATSFLADELQLVRAQLATEAVELALATEAPVAEAAQAVALTTTTTAAPAPTTTAPPPPPPTTAPPPRPPAPAPSGAGTGDPDDPASWHRLAGCESGGNWHINTGNGYYGGLQFSLSSWRAVGGGGYPHEHSPDTQIEMGKRLYHSGGGWSHWPACTRKFGWR